MNVTLRCLCALALLSVACGDDSGVTDVGPETRDVPAEADAAGNDAEPPARDAAPDIPATLDAGPGDAGPMDTGPRIDGGGFCCVPIEAADQDVCRLTETLGRGACGSVGGGGVCVWSDEPACMSEETGCCSAAMVGSEDMCAALDGARCQATRQCNWSPVPCSDACCSATRAGFEGMCEGLSRNQARCESLRDCAWSDVPECSMMETSCCMASRAGFEAFCAEHESSMAACQSVRDCIWSDAAACAPEDGCCVASRVGFEDLCTTYDNPVACGSIRDCMWEDDVLSCR